MKTKEVKIAQGDYSIKGLEEANNIVELFNFKWNRIRALAHIIYLGSTSNSLSCHVSSLTRQTSYIWSEDAKGRDDGVEKVKIKTIPFTPSSRC